MADHVPKLDTVNLILLGSFNPKIFQPAWFASEGLVSKEEADEADVRVVHPEISAFTMNKITFEITRDRIVISAALEPLFKVIRDIAVGTFDLLHFTPIHSVGINREFHFQLDSVERWHALGHKIAPKEIWNDVLEKPGTRKLAIQGVRTDSYKGHVLVQVEPSFRVHPGIFVLFNDHYDVNDPQSATGAEGILELLKANWQVSIDRALKVAWHLLDKA